MNSNFDKPGTALIWLCMLVLLLNGLLLSTQPKADTPLVINTILTPPLIDLENGGLLDRTAAEAFKRAGLGIDFQPLPAQRSLLNLDAGIDDGNLARIPGLETIFPNILMVPEKLVDFRFVAFTRNPNIEVNGWDSLQSYNLAIIHGWQIVEINTAAHKNLLKVQTAEQLFNLLLQGRVDLVIYEYSMGQAIAKALQINDIRVLQPDLAQRPLHLYLHKSHQSLVARINEALESMKSDGAYQKIFRATMPLED